MAKVSIATRQRVVILHQRGLSQVDISRQTGVSRCAVQALLQKHKETGTVEDQRRSGRPRKLSGADERHIKATRLRNRKMSSGDITSELAVSCGTLVHPSTVRRSLARSGLNARGTDQRQRLQRETSEEHTDSSGQNQENWAEGMCKQEMWTDDELEVFDSNKQSEERHKNDSM